MVKRLFLIFLICIFCFVNFDESKHTYKNNIQIDFNSSASSIEYSLDRNYEGLQSYSHNYTKVDVSFIGSLDDYDGLFITGGPVGFNNCTLSSTLLQFDNQNSCKLTIDFRPLIEGDFSIELIVMYYKITDGHIVTNNIETPQYLNLYIFKDSQHYYMSLISASKAREYSYNFLFEKGCLDLDDFDDYVYGNSLLSEQLVVPISEDFNLMSGYVHLNINNKLYGAEGIEIGVLIIYNDGSDAYFSANVDENGFYEFPFYVNSNFYSVTFLCSSRTNYVKIVSNDPSISSNSNNSLYSFSYDLTNTISSNVKYHYLMDSIEIGNTSDRDKAFILAVQFNPAGKFVEQVMKYNLMKEDCITCYYPSNNINSFNRSLKYISLSSLNVSICYHEFGHYIFNKIGIDPENHAGGAHNSYFDLAIKYSDGYGYKLAWNEGVATFFASCVQVAYNNYSWISESWLEEYNMFKNYLTSNVNFPLRESNEKTVSLILFSLVDKSFKYDNAIGFSEFFSELKKIGHINRLSELLTYIDHEQIVSTELINECLNYYNMAPYIYTYEEVVLNKDIPYKFEWNNGNYVNDSYVEKNDENIDVIYGPKELSNNLFTLHIYDNNGVKLFEKENINSIQNSEKTSYMPTISEWNNIFENATSNLGYFFISGKDTNANNSYTFTSEKYGIILDEISLDSVSESIVSDLEHLSLSFSIIRKYNLFINEIDSYMSISYSWAENMPGARMPNFIIVQWTKACEYLGDFESRDYCDNQTLAYSSYDVSGFRQYGNYFNEVYWMPYLSPQPNSNLHGNAKYKIDLIGLFNLYIKVEYHYISATAIGQQGIFIEDTEWTTASTLVEEIIYNYTF